MSRYQVTRRMPFSARTVFDVVCDVRLYPEFVPLCADARIWDERTDAQGRAVFNAELLIVYPKLALRETFVSRVTCDPAGLKIQALSDQPPVKHIDNRWRILPVGETACDVVFSLDYQMSSKVLQFALSNAFDYALRKIMRAFEERARAITSRPAYAS